MLGIEDSDNYLSPINPYSFKCHIDLGKSVKMPQEILKKKQDVIWLVKEKDLLYVAGISKNVRFLKDKKIVSLKPLYTDELSFQALCENDSVSFFYETPVSVPYDLFPQEFNLGIICSSKITDFLLSDVI